MRHPLLYALLIGSLTAAAAYCAWRLAGGVGIGRSLRRRLGERHPRG